MPGVIYSLILTFNFLWQIDGKNQGLLQKLQKVIITGKYKYKGDENEWNDETDIRPGETRMPFSQRPTARLFEKHYGKCALDFTHPAKSWCVGVVDMHYFDLDLGPMTLVLKLDLDMVATYLHAKN